jgi:translocation and assembly module TamB
MQWLRRLFHALGATLSLALTTLVALPLCLLVGVLLWAQSDSSLQHALRLASLALPAGQQLQASEVSGSVHSGGHIGHLVWKKGALEVDVQALDVAWEWRALLDGQAYVSQLHARQVRVEDRSPPSNKAPSELVLPVRAYVQFAVDKLDWAGPPALQVQALRGNYRFDGSSHSLQDLQLQIADGAYQINAELQARLPGTLKLRASGAVQAPVQIQKKPLRLLADANVQGTLWGADATLDVDLNLQPQGNARSLDAMQASLQAQLRPWQPQPIVQARGQWTALDLASLWPQAPSTRLSGQALVLPNGSGWKGDLQLQNSLPGPLNQQRLPLQSATASAQYRSGQWQVSSLQASLAGGSVQAKGALAGTQWTVTGTLQGIQPALLDSRWPGPVLAGKLSAQQTPQGIAFAGELTAERSASSLAQITHVQAQGHWAAPLLHLDTLLLEGRDARLDGQLQLDTSSYAATGHLRGNLPGAQLNIDGNASANAGQGTGSGHVSDVQALLQWLHSLPVVGASMPDTEVRGAAELSLHWAGGWKNLGSEMQLQAAASAKRLELGAQQLSELQLDLSGTLRALALQIRGKAALGTQQLALQTQAHATQTQAGQWHARLDTLQLQLAEAHQAIPWGMQLQQPVDLDWRQTAQGSSATLAAGAMRLSGPVPGQAAIQWQPVQWAQGIAVNTNVSGSGSAVANANAKGSGNGNSSAGTKPAAGAAQWSSKGQLQDLPLAWLEALGQTRLANLGLRGDLVFGGQWDASNSGGRGLRVQASVLRSSGDLQLLSAESGSSLLAAGLRDAHVSLLIDKDAVQAELVWASEAGGNARAELRTRLQTVDGSPHWAADAPVQASVHASLPRVGVWSLVAPVGWRMHGTMEADATLSGSRNNPVWKGSLEAHEMAIRSVVDGIDLSNGVMRLQVNGQHLDIAEFTLQGAGGVAGGTLTLRGAVDWLPGAPEAPLAARVRMALDAKAQAFRVTARPDQRLVVSGDLSAKLVDTRLTVRGALVADQALFVLPEDTAPKLGSDVVVTRPKPKATPGKAVPADSKPTPRLAQTVQPDISVTLDPGSNFQLQGHGINTRLAGLLTLKSEGRELAPRLTGELRTVNGTYRAYGQRLNIEQGRLRFSGAYDNPALDIRALRPNLQQVVGVEISGTAQLPVVRLYSDPDLPDADKLSWLVLGRASSNGGAETAMLQQAALALLSGQGKAPTDALFNALGLDEVSLGQAATTNLDGTTGTEATVKLGKRISRDFYVAYERSLAGTMGTFYVFYDLSRRFTLRGQSGTQNAVDLIFTTRYD